MPKFVVSTTLKDPEWNNTTVLDSGNATEQVRTLKEEFDGELQVPGSHRLVQELIEGDLVDQINLMVFPVILGTGKKAFEETPGRRNLRLEEYQFVSSVAHRPAKVTLIGPDRIGQRWDRERSAPIYADLDAFLADVVRLEREMVQGLVDAMTIGTTAKAAASGMLPAVPCCE